MKIKRFYKLIENFNVEYNGVNITLDDNTQNTTLFKNLEIDSDNSKVYDAKNNIEYNIEYIVFVEGYKETTAKIDCLHM